MMANLHKKLYRLENIDDFAEQHDDTYQELLETWKGTLVKVTRSYFIKTRSSLLEDARIVKIEWAGIGTMPASINKNFIILLKYLRTVDE